MAAGGESTRDPTEFRLRDATFSIQASPRRSVSASCYALFHLLVDEATRLMFADGIQVRCNLPVPGTRGGWCTAA